MAFSPDGKLLVSGSGDKTVMLWDAATGAALQTLMGHKSISELSFSRDGQYLETDSGLLYLQPSSQDAPSKVPPFYAISANKDWVTRHGENFIWLPSDSRGRCLTFRRNLLALGQASGRVMFIDFGSSCLT